MRLCAFKTLRNVGYRFNDTKWKKKRCFSEKQTKLRWMKFGYREIFGEMLKLKFQGQLRVKKG